MSILDCCSCCIWGSNELTLKGGKPTEDTPLNLLDVYPKYGGVKIVETSIDPQPLHPIRKQRKETKDRRFGGFLLANSILKTGETSRKMAATALWNFFEQPCRLSVCKPSNKRLLPEIAEKQWTRVDPFDGDCVNLTTGPSKHGFNGMISLHSILRTLENDPHLQITVSFFQGPKKTLDTTRKPFKARILTDEERPSSTELALLAFNGEIKNSTCKFSYVNSGDDFVKGAQFDEPLAVQSSLT